MKILLKKTTAVICSAAVVLSLFTFAGFPAGLSAAAAETEVTEENVNPVSEPAKQTLTVTARYTKTLGDKPFKLNVKSNGTGKLVFRSSNKKIATVSAAGKVTLKKAGTAKIKVYAEANEDYQKSTVKTITIKIKQPKTSKAYKKYVGKWVTVNYSLQVKAINKKYVIAVLKTKKGDYVKIEKKMNPLKKNTLHLTSKKGSNVTVVIQFTYGKPYIEYGGRKVVDGPILTITGDSQEWYMNGYDIVYQKYL